MGKSWAFDLTGRHTYRVVLEHAHGPRCARARELVEEARHGHREEPHRDDTGFHWLTCATRAGSQYRSGSWGGVGRDCMRAHLSWPWLAVWDCRGRLGMRTDGRATGEV